MKIRYTSGYKYRLDEDYIFDVHELRMSKCGNDFISVVFGEVTIHKGYSWDGPSGPTLDTPSSMRGSLVHDALYQMIREGILPRRFKKIADQLLHDICMEDGMNPVRADIWQEAVKLFGGSSLRKRNVSTAP